MLFLTQSSWNWFFEVRINSRFLHSAPGHLTSQGIIIKSSHLGVTSSHKLMTEQLLHLPSGAENLFPFFFFNTVNNKIIRTVRKVPERTEMKRSTALLQFLLPIKKSLTGKKKKKKIQPQLMRRL